MRWTAAIYPAQLAYYKPAPSHTFTVDEGLPKPPPSVPGTSAGARISAPSVPNYYKKIPDFMNDCIRIRRIKNKVHTLEMQQRLFIHNTLHSKNIEVLQLRDVELALLEFLVL